MSNVDTFKNEGMIDDGATLSQDLEDLINDLNATEVQQLIDMWKRIGEPDPDTFSTVQFIP